MGVVYAGKDATVSVGGATWKLSEFEVEMDVDILDKTNFSSSGAKENLAGLKGSKCSGKGPYDSGAMAMTAGSTYEIIFTVGGAVAFTVTYRIGTIKVSTDVKGVTTASFTGESTGSFTAAIT